MNLLDGRGACGIAARGEAETIESRDVFHITLSINER